VLPTVLTASGQPDGKALCSSIQRRLHFGKWRVNSENVSRLKVGQLARVMFACSFVSAGCSAPSSKAVPPFIPLQQRDCSAASPCNGVRSQWFSNEARDAELVAAYCSPPSPGRAGDCQGLEGAIANLHRLNFDYFSDLCSRQSGHSSTEVYAFVGRPDRDEEAPCGGAQCRVWIWYWFSGGRYGIFTILLGLPPGTSDWLLRRCNYCTTGDCQDMPPAL
jgi:hypothetical protein